MSKKAIIIFVLFSVFCLHVFALTIDDIKNFSLDYMMDNSKKIEMEIKKLEPIDDAQNDYLINNFRLFGLQLFEFVLPGVKDYNQNNQKNFEQYIIVELINFHSDRFSNDFGNMVEAMKKYSEKYNQEMLKLSRD